MTKEEIIADLENKLGVYKQLLINSQVLSRDQYHNGKADAYSLVVQHLTYSLNFYKGDQST